MQLLCFVRMLFMPLLSFARWWFVSLVCIHFVGLIVIGFGLDLLTSLVFACCCDLIVFGFDW